MTIAFFVSGTPVQQGSMKAIPTPGGVRVIHSRSTELLSWRNTVAWHAKDEMGTQEPGRGPVSLSLCFYHQRPKGHYRTGRHAAELKHDAPLWKDTAPDLDKQVRAVLDALTGVAYVDDRQVCEIVAQKKFQTETGLAVTVRFL